jgi:hypothetical protein
MPSRADSQRHSSPQRPRALWPGQSVRAHRHAAQRTTQPLNNNSRRRRNPALPEATCGHPSTRPGPSTSGATVGQPRSVMRPCDLSRGGRARERTGQRTPDHRGAADRSIRRSGARLRRSWRVMDSNLRSLCRRFYRGSPFPARHRADLPLQPGRTGRRPVWSVICPYRHRGPVRLADSPAPRRTVRQVIRGMSPGPETDVKVMATALAAGILLDATVVRALLVPALVAVFDRWTGGCPVGRRASCG